MKMQIEVSEAMHCCYCYCLAKICFQIPRGGSTRFQNKQEEVNRLSVKCFQELIGLTQEDMEVRWPLQKERVIQQLRKYAHGPHGLPRAALEEVTVHDGAYTEAVSQGIAEFVAHFKALPIASIDTEASFAAGKSPYFDEKKGAWQWNYLICTSMFCKTVIIKLTENPLPEPLVEALSGPGLYLGSGVKRDLAKLERFGIKVHAEAMFQDTGVLAKCLYEDREYVNVWGRSPPSVFKNEQGERELNVNAGLGRQAFVANEYNHKVNLPKRKFETKYGVQKTWPWYKRVGIMYDWQSYLKTHQIYYCANDGQVPVSILWLYLWQYHPELLTRARSEENVFSGLVEVIRNVRRWRKEVQETASEPTIGSEARSGMPAGWEDQWKPASPRWEMVYAHDVGRGDGEKDDEEIMPRSQGGKEEARVEADVEEEAMEEGVAREQESTHPVEIPRERGEEGEDDGGVLLLNIEPEETFADEEMRAEPGREGKERKKLFKLKDLDIDRLDPKKRRAVPDHVKPGDLFSLQMLSRWVRRRQGGGRGTKRRRPRNEH